MVIIWLCYNIGDMMEKLQKNNQQEKLAIPEYFDNFLEEGYEKYAGHLKKYVDRVEEKNMKDINFTLENMGYENGIELAAEYIAGALDIDKPEIKFQIIKDKNGIRYGCDRRDNSIVVRRTLEERYEDVLGISDAVEMIAHESWHAHQHNEIRNNSERAQLLYKRDYIKPQDSLEGYYRQPYELEAYVFGEMVRNKFSEIRKEFLSRELDKTIGAIAECVADGNKHLVPVFIEDKEKIMKELHDLSEEEGDRIRDDKRRRFNYTHRI